MEQNKYNINNNEGNSNDFNIREEVDKYLFHWKWFLLSLLFAIAIGYVYLRYATPIYSASATILVKDDKKGALSEFSGLSELGGLGNVKSNLENEIEILKSRTLIEKTVKELRLNYIYIIEGRVKSPDIYNSSPVIVDFKSKESEENETLQKIRIVSKSNNQYELLKENDDSYGVFAFGQSVTLPNGTVTIVRNPKYQTNQNDENFDIRCFIYPVKSVLGKYTGDLQVVSLNKMASVLNLTFKDEVPKRAEDFLNALVSIYNNEAIEDKNEVSEKTFQFIAKRLQLITDELTVVEKDVEFFKKSNKLTDIPAEAGIYLETESEYQNNIIATQIQQNVVGSVISFLRNSKNSDLIPNNLVPGEGDSSSLIVQYNELVLQRNRLAKGATALNPSLIAINQQIEDLKGNVLQSLVRLQANLKIKQDKLNEKDASISNKKEKVPSLEREFRIIDRQQKVKEALYLYLLQKREETALTLAATENNAKVIDAAQASKTPVSPKKMIIMLACLVAGLLIPFIIIYLNDLLNTKIITRLDLDKRITIPFLGDIPKSESHGEMMNATSRTSSAEAVRIIRTNLEFMLSKVPKDKAKTVFVTSTIPGEGKTFVSINLASTIALSGKKVVLVGLDVRNPKFTEYLDVNPKGVTNFVSTQDANLKDFISSVPNFRNFDVLASGIIPPNPVELLMDDKITEMFDELKKNYDYIIVDTAPVSLVTDTILVASNADAFVYVVRANYLDRRMLRVPEMFYNEKKLPNMSMVLNDTKMTNKGYGYGYGYGYGKDVTNKKSWFQKLFQK
jgi:tyrosine-protein kinase Etk/Wzc